MTPKQLQEIKAREQAATLGEWRHYVITDEGIAPADTIIIDHVVDVVGTPNTGVCCGVDKAENAQFIARARTDIPALVAEVERLTAENENQKYQLCEYGKRSIVTLSVLDSIRRDITQVEQLARDKDQRIATLEKALQETRLTLSAIYGTSGKFADETILRYWQAQAQEQEATNE